MPPLQTVAIRYLGSFILIAFLLNPRSHPGIMHTQRFGLQIARAICLVIMSVCIFTALRYLPLTMVASISFVSPLVTAVLAAPILGESLGPRRVAAVLLAVLTAFLNAIYSITTRLLAAHDSPRTTMFYTGLVSAIVVAPILPFVWETPASPSTWLIILLFCTAGALGHWLLILAHARSPASVLAPFFYSQLIWATLIGTIVFGESPDRWTMIGGGIVISSGLYLLYRERVRHRRPSVDVGV